MASEWGRALPHPYACSALTQSIRASRFRIEPCRSASIPTPIASCVGKLELDVSTSFLGTAPQPPPYKDNPPCQLKHAPHVAETIGARNGELLELSAAALERFLNPMGSPWARGGSSRLSVLCWGSVGRRLFCVLMCLGLFLLAISDDLKQCLGTKGLDGTGSNARHVRGLARTKRGTTA